MEIEQIKNHLRRALVGEKLQYIVRSCELIDFGFGELFRRKIKPKSDYPLKTLYPRAFQTGQNHLIYYDFTTVE